MIHWTPIVDSEWLACLYPENDFRKFLPFVRMQALNPHQTDERIPAAMATCPSVWRAGCAAAGAVLGDCKRSCEREVQLHSSALSLPNETVPYTGCCGVLDVVLWNTINQLIKDAVEVTLTSHGWMDDRRRRSCGTSVDFMSLEPRCTPHGESTINSGDAQGARVIRDRLFSSLAHRTRYFGTFKSILNQLLTCW